MALSGICASGGTHIPAMFIQCLSVALAPRPRALPFCKCLDHKGRSISQGPVLYMKKGGAVDKRPAQFIEIEDIAYDSWKLDPAIQSLKEGGLGIIPTDTSYSFVTPITSREGVERIYGMREITCDVKKPLALLCSSISQISMYTTATNSKRGFKMLKELLPGPYTFIFPASSDLPRVILDHKKHKKTFKRSEIGVRMPDDPVCREILAEVDVPLLCATVPPASDGAEFCSGTALEEFARLIDFYVDAGARNQELPSEQQLFTSVVDFTNEPPEILRDAGGAAEALEEWL